MVSLTGAREEYEGTASWIQQIVVYVEVAVVVVVLVVVLVVAEITRGEQGKRRERPKIMLTLRGQIQSDRQRSGDKSPSATAAATTAILLSRRSGL